MKLKLIDDWKDAWKWISVNCMLVAAAVQGTWATIPEYLRDRVPAWAVSVSTVGLLILGVLGRVLQQGKPKAVPVKKPAKKRKR